MRPCCPFQTPSCKGNHPPTTPRNLLSNPTRGRVRKSRTTFKTLRSYDPRHDLPEASPMECCKISLTAANKSLKPLDAIQHSLGCRLTKHRPLFNIGKFRTSNDGTQHQGRDAPPPQCCRRSTPERELLYQYWRMKCGSNASHVYLPPCTPPSEGFKSMDSLSMIVTEIHNGHITDTNRY